MEAKPLRTPADLTGRYLGAEGLGCFTDRDPPYSTDLAAGMVGYAFRDAPTWLGRLASALPTNTMATQIADVILTGGRNAVASDHPRAGGLNPVTVIHAVLDFVEAQT